MNVSSSNGFPLSEPAADPGLWLLDPEVIFLNHGSFGACPRPVLEFQQRLRERLERQPVNFLVRELEPLWDEARSVLAGFVGAAAEDLVFMPNATTGVNTVLRSLMFAPGDELLVTNHEYNACRNALDFVAQRAGAVVVVADIPFPFQRQDELVEPILAKVTPRTKLALLDHVTSQTGLVLPIQPIVRELAARGVETLVDGSHAPGMVPLDLTALNAAYYTGNCHKWICAPKGAAFLVVRRDLQEMIRPLTISHGANSPRQDRSRFLIEFGWTGTSDPTAWLTVPEAVRFIGRLMPGGWPEIRQRNRALAIAGRRILCGALGSAVPCPDDFLGSMGSIVLPPSIKTSPPAGPLYLDALQDELVGKHRIEVPVIPWSCESGRLLRVSAQLYNHQSQYERLGSVLRGFLRG